MNVALLALGVATIALAVVDLLWTTLWVDGGAGPLSTRLTARLSSLLDRVGSARSLSLSLAGPLVLLTTLTVWLGLLWAGWTLVFASAEAAVVDPQGSGDVGWVSRAYFAGYVLFTLGNGGYAPGGPAWEIATVLATASGMLLVTTSVSYVLSVLGAVADKRSFAGTVTGLGDSPAAFVRSGLDGEDFDGFDLPLHDLAARLDRLAVQHRAYPILHYYHAERPSRSAALAVAIFDEATTILRDGVSGELGPDAPVLQEAEASIDDYVETLAGAFVDPAAELPPAPELDPLRGAGVPTRSDEAFRAALESQASRRRALLGTVEAESWDWPPVDGR